MNPLIDNDSRPMNKLPCHVRILAKDRFDYRQSQVPEAPWREEYPGQQPVREGSLSNYSNQEVNSHNQLTRNNEVLDSVNSPHGSRNGPLTVRYLT